MCPYCQSPMFYGVHHDCARAGLTITQTQTFPSHVEHPVDPPTVAGTLITVDVGLA